jgi:hypothetical protein
MSDHISDEELLQALDRIARTPDGALLYLYFQRAVLELFRDPSANNGALRAHEGRRNFAAELMGRMARGIDESGRATTSQRTGYTTERPVVFRTAGNTAGKSRLSVRERIAADDPELRGFTVQSGSGRGDAA